MNYKSEVQRLNRGKLALLCPKGKRKQLASSLFFPLKRLYFVYSSIKLTLCKFERVHVPGRVFFNFFYFFQWFSLKLKTKRNLASVLILASVTVHCSAQM